jgi:hypothetical protein
LWIIHNLKKTVCVLLFCYWKHTENADSILCLPPNTIVVDCVVDEKLNQNVTILTASSNVVMTFLRHYHGQLTTATNGTAH